MATKSISQLDTQATANETDLFEVAIVDANSASGYASKKESAAAIADAIVGSYQYPLRITGTTAKTIAGAINELKNLVDLLPQFAIEVVQTLPVSDISTTTIYLVPASDPEQGNYYEEYIYVNQTWELVGTTAVDLSGYYTSAQVDTLLAAKANISSLATVATSGAYSDLSGKPTIDTALDDTSTNAVENRAVASEINSIKSDITVEGSASGDICSFVDGADAPFADFLVNIVAVQEGEGDPSPQNVMPISGWTGCNIPVRGFNLWDEQYLSGYYTSSGSFNSTETQLCTKNIIPVKPGKEIYLKVPLISGTTSLDVCEYAKDGTFIRRELSATVTLLNGGVTFTIPNDCYGINVNFTTYYGRTYNNNICINVSSSENGTYKPYDPNSETYNIDWQSTAGTVYVGNINPLTGELTATYALRHFDENTNWSKGGSQTTGGFNRFYFSPNPTMKSGSAQSGLCDKFLIGNVSSSVPVVVLGYNNTAIQVLSTANDITEFETEIESYGGIDVLYPLATPVTYQLTPVQVRSLLGQNNIWADCGSITELKYTHDLNLCINDIISRLEALENASSSRSLSVSPTLTKSLTSELGEAEGKAEETEEETKEEEAQKNER